MTQVLAIRCNEGILFAADTCVQLKYPDGRLEKGEPEHKLFNIGGRFAALTFGEGPQSHVPTTMQNLQPSETIGLMSEALLASFNNNQPAPNMGILLAGGIANSISLFEISIAQPKITDISKNIIIARGVINEANQLPEYSESTPNVTSVEETKVFAEKLLLATSKIYPDYVSPPLEFLLVSKTGINKL